MGNTQWPKCLSAFVIVFCFNSFRRPNAGSLLAVCSWSLARSFLLTVILAKCHSSLEADKQQRSLEGASSLWRCVCACLSRDQCDAEGDWCSPLSERLLSGTLAAAVAHWQDSAKTASLESHVSPHPSLWLSLHCSHHSLYFFFHCSVASLALSDFALDLTWKSLCQTDVDWWNNLSQGEYYFVLCLSGCVVLDTEFKQLY